MAIPPGAPAEKARDLYDRLDAAIEKSKRLRKSHDRLLASLENIVPRFHRCCVYSGNSHETADASVADARAAILAAKDV